MITMPEKAKLAGNYSNGRSGKPRLRGRATAKKLGVSTVNAYAYRKQASHGRFVRKQPTDRGTARAK